MISSFGAILAWKSDDDAAADADADDDYDDDRKSDPYMSPSYAGDTKSIMASLATDNAKKLTKPNEVFILLGKIRPQNLATIHLCV